MEKSSIENIFKKGLENYEIQPDEDEWSAVDLALPRVNFLRFSFVNFNIYYCSLIVLCFLFSALSLIYTLSGRNARTHATVAGEKERIEYPAFDKSGKTETEKINENSKSLATQKVSVVKEKPKEVLKTESLSKDKNNPELNLQIPKAIKQDSLENKEKTHPLKVENTIITESSQPEQQKKKDAKKKRIVYITKQDTIIVIDTLSKRKLKRKN
ncbi:hypothetical protein [Sporocytophaga myxococcoides]|uniref:hypothetical protein n=1 Tax=Sporocytophaga myxococcoides TaxID=153721 RepID=UPI0003FF34C5|nr:hypothetical protein [Sporocytophaga myxococcoides]